LKNQEICILGMENDCRNFDIFGKSEGQGLLFNIESKENVEITISIIYQKIEVDKNFRFKST